MTMAIAGVVLVPVAVALGIAVAGARGVRWAGPASVMAAATALGLAVLSFDAGAGPEAPWFTIGELTVGVGLRADPLGSFMAVLIAGVCFVVQIYAVAYMGGDPRRHILFAWLSLFTGAMLALVLADSLVLLFVAWELVSVASFALIAYHHVEPEARSAAVRALTAVRAGDVGLLLAIALLLVAVGDTSQAAVLGAVEAGEVGGRVAAIASVGLLLAAIAKSAQLPLSAWLPGAMVAPTPVSALLHSATMVAAGVYLLLRFLPLLQAAPFALELAVWIGAATALVGALAAASASDLKRVLAWSTVAHLGEMILIVGHASPAAATFLLTTHALFKAALFLVAGAVQQRARRLALAELGGLARSLPLETAAFALAALALVGIPPLGGFFSEEAVLAASSRAGSGWAWFAVGLLFLAGTYIGRAGAAVFGPWPGARRPAVGAPRPLATGAFVALVAAAAAAGLVARPIDALFPGTATSAPATTLTIAAIVAGVLGLGFGIVRVWRSGPVPAFGPGLGTLERAAEAMLSLGGRAALGAGLACRAVERGLDAAARAVGGGGSFAAATAARIEGGLDAVSAAAGSATLACARGAASVDRAGFGRGGDGVANGIDAAGGQLQRLQAGRLYLYTASLFVSAVVLGTLAVVIAMM